MKERIWRAAGLAKKAVISKEFLLALCVGGVLVITVAGTLMGFFRDKAILSANRNAEIVSLLAKNAVHAYVLEHSGEALRGKTFYGNSETAVAADGSVILELKGVPAGTLPAGTYGFAVKEGGTEVVLAVWSADVMVAAGDMVTFSVGEQISDYTRHTLVGFWAP